MQKKITAILTALILTITTINAQAMETIGARSCGMWISQKGDVANEAWVVGYLSGVVVATGKNALVGTDNASIYLWIDNYCRANPLKHTGEAAANLFHELVKQKKL